MMLKKIDVKELKSDLRKLALACSIGGLTGIFLGSYDKIFASIALLIWGISLWYFALRKKENTDV